MDSSATRIDQEELLAQLGWVRTLAQRLVADPDIADDVLQRVCLLALEKAPDRARSGPGFRAWLATSTRRLARNSARTETRRRRRELAASQAHAVSPTDEVAARREMLRRVMEAVIELPEPHFSILVNRYYEGREVAEIAQRSGLMEAAVRQRLSRARRELRARLGGDAGSVWMTALAPFAWLWGTVTRFSGLGGGVMAKEMAGWGLSKILIAAALITAVGLTTWWVLVAGEVIGGGASQSMPNAAEVVRSEVSAAHSPEAGNLMPAPRVAEVQPLVAVGAPVEVDVVSAAPALEPFALVTGRLLGPRGEPVQGALVLVGWNGSQLWSMHWDEMRRGATGVSPSVFSDSEGRFGVDAGLSSGQSSLGIGPQVVVLHEQFRSLAHPLDGLAAGGFDVGDLRLAPGGRLTGRVVDEDGESVVDAWVMAAGETIEDQTLRGSERVRDYFVDAVTDPDGRFLMAGMDARYDRIRVQARGHLDAVLADLPIRPGTSIDVGDIVLQLGATIAGVVVDTSGAPIRRVSLSADGQHRSRGSGQSDAAGAFLISGLEPGAYSVHASGRGYAWSRAFDVPANGTPLRLVMQRLGTLEVRVLDALTDAPVGEVLLDGTLPAAERKQAWSDWQFEMRPPVDSDAMPGIYRLDGAGPEGTELTVSAPGYVTAVIHAPGVGDGATLPLLVKLQPALTLAGRVIDTLGAGVPDASVVAVPLTGGRRSHASSDDDGSFLLDALALGEWEVSATAESFGPDVARTVVLEDGAPHEPLTIVLARSGSIAGSVFSVEGEPVPGAQVVATMRAPADTDWGDRRKMMQRLEPDSPYTLHYATADGAGRYRYGQLPAGRYVLWVQDGSDDHDVGTLASLLDEQTERHWSHAEVVPGEMLELDLHIPARILVHGRITSGGVPLAGAHIVLADADVDYLEAYAPSLGSAKSNDLGEYELTVRGPGNYWLIAVAQQSATPVIKRVELHAADRRMVDFEFHGKELLVRVLDEAGDVPLEGCRVSVNLRLDAASLGDGAPWGRQYRSTIRNIMRNTDIEPFEWTTGADGTVRLSGLPAARHTLYVDREGYLHANVWMPVTDTAAPQEQTVRLVRGAVITGAIDAVGLTLPEQLTVGLSIHPPAVHQWSEVEDGRFRFDALEPGIYTLTVFSRLDYNKPLGSRTATVTAGQTIETTLTLDP